MKRFITILLLFIITSMTQPIFAADFCDYGTSGTGSGYKPTSTCYPLSPVAKYCSATNCTIGSSILSGEDVVGYNFTCATGFTSFDESSIRYCICGAGKYWNGSACTTCGPSGNYCPGGALTALVADGTGRTACPAGYTSSDAGISVPDLCYRNCPTDPAINVTGRDYSNNSYDSCAASCPNGGTGTVTWDAANSKFDLSGCTKVVSCNPAHGTASHTCSYTSGNGSSAQYNSSCTTCTALTCDAGYYFTSPLTCTACPNGSYKTNTTLATSCTLCSAGQDTNGATGSATNTCVACDNTGGVYSWTSPTWSSGSVSDLCSINKCDLGYYGNSSSCTRCPKSSASFRGSQDSSCCMIPTTVTITDKYGYSYKPVKNAYWTGEFFEELPNTPSGCPTS